MPAAFSKHDAPSDAIVNTCIKCGFCLPTCPTYQLTLDERSSPRGRIELVGQVIEGKLPADDPTFRSQMFECLGCRNCEPVCPSGVRFGALLENARAQIAQADRRTAGGALRALAYDVLFSSALPLRLLAILVRWYRLTGLQQAVRSSGLLKVMGLDRVEARLPRVEHGPFPVDGSTWPSSAGSQKGTVALFSGCVMAAAFANVHEATIRVLSANGWNVEVTRGQGCCGALHLHAGYKDRAREFAREIIATFEKSQAQYIVVNAAGCGAELKEYGHLLEDDPQWRGRARRFARRVRDFSELLAADGLNVSALRHTRARVAYQDACHLVHAQRISKEPRALLDAMPGIERVEMAEADRCCGSAGIYNITHPAFASQLGRRKIEAARAVNAERIVTSNPGCQLQLSYEAGEGEGPHVQHIAELLDEALKVAYVTTRVQARPPSRQIGGLALVLGGIATTGLAVMLLRRFMSPK